MVSSSTCGFLAKPVAAQEKIGWELGNYAPEKKRVQEK
jgi:hypothetical protein